jgi:hypothetical protein
VRPESAIACRAPARPALQHLPDFFVTSKLAPIGLGDSLLDFLKLPPFQSLNSRVSFLVRVIVYAAPNLTDTSFDTPGSCIVTP